MKLLYDYFSNRYMIEMDSEDEVSNLCTALNSCNKEWQEKSKQLFKELVKTFELRYTAEKHANFEDLDKA